MSLRYSYEEIRDRIKSNFTNEASKIEGTFTMDNIQAVSNELAKIMDLEVLSLPDKVLIDTAEGNMLDRKALDFNMYRTEKETDESFRTRIIERIQKPIMSGNKNHYIHWAKSIDGVGDAKVISCWNGNGTVKVVVLSNEHNIPSDEVIKNVAEYIEEQRPIGAEVTVSKAIPSTVIIDANIVIENGFSIEEIKEIFINDLNEYLFNISFDENKPLSYHKIGVILFGISGVLDVLGYSLNGLETSLNTEVEEFFILGEVILNGN